jgi:tRNA threonylcarbamoyl adenosine modification protein (Sua5/YciO/YrdC/YwlC family)
MIDYVQEHSIDSRVLERASLILRRGGIICFPTETNWIVAADPFHKGAVDKLYQLRHIENTKHLTVMCPNFQCAMEIAHINDSAFSLLKKVVPGSYTFIFEAHKKITRFLKASKSDHQVGIRFPPKNLCQSLLRHFDSILITTHITHDMIEDSDPEIPLYSAQIEDELGHIIDLIIDTGDVEFLGQTTIIDFTSGAPEVLRKGIGNASLFE